jgi:nitrite reductase (NADH) small subunit
MSAAVQGRTEVAVGPENRFISGRFMIVDAGRHSIGIIRLHDGELKAVRNWCPHKGAPICRGIVGGTWPPSQPGELQFDRDGEVLVCPWHGFEFDLKDGQELYQERPTHLSFFPVSVRDGTVYVTV